MQLTASQWNTLNKWLMIAGVGLTILGPVVEYLVSGQVINSAGVMTALGLGVAAYAKRAPGHFTPDQANERAAQAVRDVVLPPGVESVSQLPPAVPGDDA